MASEAGASSRSSSTADSYIGSLISLTSKSEIRYEGVLYNISTEESSIGLRNVRSFGTEGRKKDGPQIPPGDKVYEYILFRGSDIKDLQVKSSPSVNPSPPINNDPAIIQSHYPHPVATSASLPSSVGGSLTDLSSHTAQLGLPGSNFQGGLPLYQPGGNLGSWGASPPPTANGGGLAMPMYWQGYYAPPNGLPHLHQQSLLRPPPGLSMPPSMQQMMQYPNFTAPLPPGATNLPPSNFPFPSLPEAPSPSLPGSNSSVNLASTSLAPSTLPSNLLPVPSATLALETLPNSMLKAPNSALPTAALTGSFPSLSPLTSSGPELNAIIPPSSNKTNAISGITLPPQNTSQTISSIVGTANSLRTETPTPSLVTPGQLLQSGPTPISSSQFSPAVHKDVEVVQITSSSISSEPTAPVTTDAQPPILPLPLPSQAVQKTNGATSHSRYGYRGRERGRGSGSSRPVTKFTEDFDFTAMNEKFKKDEVWGYLGKSNKSQTKDEGDGKVSDEDYFHDEDDADTSKTESKSVYNKDDFFDSLSCNALDHNSHNGRPKFSEQMKIDTETFGDFSRHHGGRGGRGPGRGFRARGSYYGRGYGYVGRGRGWAAPGRDL